ncbi:putative E3 ubiquitin-protein ligase [Sesbania bispinosa]|nr:putative E3 ubiquitin-protein ligase [Sesbania bispinosa]
MNAGIAGVARIIERLDLTSKVSVLGELQSFLKKANAPSLVSSMVAGRMEIPPCVQSQSGHDAVKT